MIRLIAPGLSGLRSAALVLGLFLGLSIGAHAAADGKVLVAEIVGPIGVASTDYFAQVIEQARTSRAAAIVLRLDTPGGLVSATRDMIKAMIASPVPIIVYVAPSGARAASAGTFLVYASHLAAMAPGTNLGAATPIELGGVPGLPQPTEQKKTGESTDSQRKMVNDVVAFLRGLAQLRGRNVEFAEKAVREAATLTAFEAQKDAVVEIVADSIDSVLAQADGRRVTVNGENIVLATRNATIEEMAPDLRTKLFSVIADPNIAFILLMIGVYGIMIEFFTPGVFAPGVIGAVCLILAMIALSTLPVQYGALGLVVLGIGLMIAETFVPSGALAVGGGVAFVIGALFLFEPGSFGPGAAISLPVIAGAALACAALALFIGGAALKARARPVRTGDDEIVGNTGRIVSWQDGGRGQVRIRGEVWAAEGSGLFKDNDMVRIVRRNGLTLIIEPFVN